MTIQEILEAHQLRWDSSGDYGEISWVECSCSNADPNSDSYWTGDSESDHRAHLAEVLNKHMQEREARAWDRLVGYAPFTAFERVRLRCENPFREEPSDD